MIPNWHNIKVTRRDPITNQLVVSSDFEYSVEDAVENDHFHNRPVVNVVQVEFCGPSIASYFDKAANTTKKAWQDVTELYKMEFHRRQYVS